MEHRIMTFESVHHALKAEKILRLKGLTIHVMNTPREVSKDCGICLRFDVDDETDITNAMEEANAAFAGIYRIDYS